MKAAYLQNNHIHIGEVPDPVSSKGQALVRTHTCGLCASDAHFLHGGEAVVEMSRKFGGPYAKLDLGRVIVMGHEYVGEIIDYGLGGRIGLAGVAEALQAMSSPTAPVRTVVDPRRM